MKRLLVELRNSAMREVAVELYKSGIQRRKLLDFRADMVRFGDGRMKIQDGSLEIYLGRRCRDSLMAYLEGARLLGSKKPLFGTGRNGERVLSARGLESIARRGEWVAVTTPVASTAA